jgi:hypothetical protein
MTLPATAGARGGLRRKLLLTLASLAVALAAAELAMRALSGARGRPYSARAAREEIANLRDASRNFRPRVSQRVLHPYVGSELVENLELLRKEIARLDEPRPPGEYQILLVGSSVAGLFAQHGAGRLREVLEADPSFAGRRVRFLDFARGAFKQPQQLDFVLYLLSEGFHPDAIVDISGLNEVALASENASRGTHPIYPDTPQWGFLCVEGNIAPEALALLAEIRRSQRSIEAWSAAALDWRLCSSSVLGELCLGRLRRERTACANAAKSYAARLLTPIADPLVHGPMRARGPPGDGREDLELCVRIWSEAARSLDAVCRDRSIEFLEVLQPTLHDAGSKPLAKAEIPLTAPLPTLTAAIQQGYPLLRTAAANLAKEGVRVLDASLAFADVETELYYDFCHFNDTGNRILAERIAEALLRAVR